ncbi:MAG: IPT/TIG domain-containing protein [Alphaproteobacteria bacterium]|nr:IPT/TIG domain-containing protein [Alphaproteobacteria bacterium]MCB9793902.1 IPT/TIG domain-containing protein [Alphaproteobacteria bacterium]
MLSLLTLLGGCQYGLDSIDSVPLATDSEDEGDQRCAGQPVCITELSPDWGPTSGGTQVTVRGVGFGPGPSIFFGNAELDVTVTGTDELVITTPGVPVEGGVDVRVDGRDGSYTLTDGFTYSDSGPPDTGSGGDDSGGGGGDDSGEVQPTGQTGGLIEATYTVVGCPACFNMSDYLSSSVVAVFHTPVNASWYDWLGPQGGCVQNPTRGGLASQGYDLGQWAYLSSGSTSLSLRRESTQGLTIYNTGPLGQYDIPRNAAMDFSVAGGGNLGAFELADVVETSEGFSDIQPVAILNDQNNAFGASVQSGNATFTWSPNSLAESFVVGVGVYNRGGSFLGEVVCHTSDSGRFTVPAGYLQGYPSGSLLAIEMYRLQRAEVVNPADGSTVEGSFTIGVLGTGTLR